MGATEILVGGGVAAILAALAGGGLKAFGVELPILASVNRQVLVALTGIALVALGLLLDRGAAGVGPKIADAPLAPPGAGHAPSTVAAAEPAPAAAVPQKVAPARPEVPNITGLPFAAARQFLIQNAWSPINFPSPPMANDNLGLRAKEVSDAGYFETVRCSGSSMAPCLFRYRNPGGYVLEVVAVGEDLTRTVVNDTVILDCTASPRPEGCAR